MCPIELKSERTIRCPASPVTRCGSGFPPRRRPGRMPQPVSMLLMRRVRTATNKARTVSFANRSTGNVYVPISFPPIGDQIPSEVSRTAVTFPSRSISMMCPPRGSAARSAELSGVNVSPANESPGMPAGNLAAQIIQRYPGQRRPRRERAPAAIHSAAPQPQLSTGLRRPPDVAGRLSGNDALRQVVDEHRPHRDLRVRRRSPRRPGTLQREMLRQ